MDDTKRREFWKKFSKIKSYNDEKIKNSTGQLIESLKAIRDNIRKNLWSICFTENYNNETLWLKYANNHKGIVLEYDSDIFKRACEDDVPYHISMYPVVYSEDSYDFRIYHKKYCWRGR